jgi:uncharacterized membrane protein (DUF373 family)
MNQQHSNVIGFFNKITDIIIKLLIPLVILALFMGFAKVVLDLRVAFSSPTISNGFDILITDILSMFVVIELLRSIIECFEIRRLKITFIIDAGLVFILREIMIVLYKNKIEFTEVLSLSALLIVLGIIRTLAILHSPDKHEGVVK